MNRDKQQYWKRIYKGMSIDQAKNRLSNKFLEELKEYEKNKTLIQKELQIFLKRLLEGQSPKSALSGLSTDFKDWYFFITKPEPKPDKQTESIEINEYEPGKAIGPCSYCNPRGNKAIHELKKCSYCNEWFCEQHLRPYRKKEDDLGHPCTKYGK